MTNYVYNGLFHGNVWIVGRTGCEKTHFMHKQAVNIFFFGKLNKVEWICCIKLDKSREAEIQSCFDGRVEFHCPKNKNHFESLLQEFKLRSKTNKSSIKDINSTDLVNSGYGENIKRDRLIGMDDIRGLADTSKKFESFLTAARKFKYHCD